MKSMLSLLLLPQLYGCDCFILFRLWYLVRKNYKMGLLAGEAITLGIPYGLYLSGQNLQAVDEIPEFWLWLVLVHLCQN